MNFLIATVVRRLAGAALLLCLAQALPAQEGYFGVDIGLGEDDNVGRSASGISSDVQRLGLRFRAAADRSRLQGMLIGNLQGRRYDKDAVPDNNQIVGSVDGSLAVGLVPDRFIWDLQQNYGQANTNPLLPDGPNNRGAATVVSTGPRIRLLAGSRNSLDVSGSVSERSYEKRPELDGRRTSARLAFERAVSQVTTVSLAVDDWKSEIDASPQTYEYQSVSFAYRKQFSSGGVEVRIGRGRIDTGITDDPTSIGTLAWRRDLGTRSDLRLWMSRDYTDAGELFRLAGLPRTDLVGLSDVPGSSPEAPADDADPMLANDDRLDIVILTSNPVLRSTAGVRFGVDGSRTDIGFSLTQFRNRYTDSSSFDSDGNRIAVDVSHDFGGRVSGSLTLSQQNRDFFVAGRDNRDRRVGVSMRRALGRNAGISLTYQTSRRTSGLQPYRHNVWYVLFSRDFRRQQ